MPSTIRTTIHRNGYSSVKELMTDLVGALASNGFNQVFPTSVYPGEGTVILQPTSEVDPLYDPSAPAVNGNSWRLAFTVNAERVNANAATALQLMDDGTLAKSAWASEPKMPGEIEDWIDRSDFLGMAGQVYPMSFLISISDHGVFIAVWDEGFDEYQNESAIISPAFRWILVQRPVDHLDGSVYLNGQAPVFCVYTKHELTYVPCLSGEPQTTLIINDQSFKQARAQKHYKFTVREADIYRPSLTRPADENREDSAAILNSCHQVSISEDNRYVITIPKGLNSTRYAYTQELDMMAFTSSDVLGQGSELELDVYGTKYTYMALVANRVKNTGMRVFVRTA